MRYLVSIHGCSSKGVNKRGMRVMCICVWLCVCVWAVINRRGFIMAMCWALTERAGKTQINTAKCRSILATLVCNKLKPGWWLRWFIQLSFWMCMCVSVCARIYTISLQLVPYCLLVLKGKNKGKKGYILRLVCEIAEQGFHLPVFVSFLRSCPVFSFPLLFCPPYSPLSSLHPSHPIYHQSLL